LLSNVHLFYIPFASLGLGLEGAGLDYKIHVDQAYYFACGSGCEVLRRACHCVCLSVCLSARISPVPQARSLPNCCGCWISLRRTNFA